MRLVQKERAKDDRPVAEAIVIVIAGGAVAAGVLVADQEATVAAIRVAAVVDADGGRIRN